MKRFLFIILSSFIYNSILATDYYSQTGQTDPNSFSSWNINPGGGGASPTSFTDPGDKFIVQTGHSMTTTAVWTIGSATSTLQIQIGAILKGDHSIILTGTFQIDNGGTYIHNNKGSVAQASGMSIFSGTESFASNSNIEIRDWINYLVGIPNSPTITWGDLIVNLQVDLGGAWNWDISNGSTLTIAGDLDIQFTGSPSRDLRLSGTGVQTINVGGDLIIRNDSYLAMKKNSSPPVTGFTTMQVEGGIQMTHTATLYLGISSSSPDIDQYELRFKEGLTTSSANIIISGTTDVYLVANGTTSQNINCLMPSIACNFQVDNSSGIFLSQHFKVNGIYEIEQGNTTLNNFDFTVNSILQTGIPDLTSNHVVTNGSGNLTILSVGAGPVAFPVGPSADSLNTLSISNGGGNDFSVRVEKGINPGISFPTYGINRTWNIQASGANSGVLLDFQYATADANAGALPQPQAMEILEYTGSAWSISPGNINIMPTGADPAWIVTTVSGLSIPTASSLPLALGRNGGWVLPIDCIITTRAQKINNTGRINWTVNSCADVTSFEVQRSVNNGSFQTIGTTYPGIAETDFSFTDATLGSGRNLCRIKVNRLSGAIKYSNTVVIIHNSNDILISSLAPNPVHNIAKLVISTGKTSMVDFKVYNISGMLVKQWQAMVTEGNNIIEMNVSGLPAGMYNLFVANEVSNSVSRFVKQ